MPKHTTIVRRPESILESWERFGRENNAPAEFFGYREWGEKFLAWLRARREYSGNSLHRYMVDFRKLMLFLAREGVAPEDYSLQVHAKAVARRVVTEPAVPKLFARFLWETLDKPEYERLYHRIKARKNRKRLPEVLSRAQVERLFSAAVKFGFDFKVLLEVIYESGARVGEILQLRVGDVVFDEYGAKIYIKHSKSIPRTVRVIVYAADLQRLVHGRAPGEYVFLKNYNTYLRYLEKAWREAGLPEMRRKFHALRHTRATELYGKLPERELMVIFGWRTRAMIDVYARVKPEDVEQHYLEVMGAKKPPQRQDTIRCPRCGHVNPAGAEHCLRCGLPLSPDKQRESAEREAELQAALAEIKRLAAELKALKQSLQV